MLGFGLLLLSSSAPITRTDRMDTRGIQNSGNSCRHWLGSDVTELPSTPKIKQQSSITNPHSETGHFHIKSMPKCGKFGAASTAGWGAGAAIFSPVGRVVLLQKGGSPPQTPPPLFGRTVHPDAIGSLHLEALLSSGTVAEKQGGTSSGVFVRHTDC